jgi:O-antigen ligase
VAASGGGLVAAAIFPSILPDSVRSRLGETSSEEALYHEEGSATTLDKSSSHRLVLWKGAARMIATHPLTGVGLGRFQQNIWAYTDVPLKKTDPHDAHNAYLLQAAEMGLPSLALMLLVLASFGLIALRLRLRHPHWLDRALGAAYLSSLGAVLVSCLLGSRFSDEALIGGFWILSALVVVVGKARPRPRRRLHG